MAEERVERRVTAILAAGVASYPRLMSRNEEGIVAELMRHWRELFAPKIREHRGRIAKTTGDGIFVEFSSVVDAVRCALDIQRQMAERNADVPPDRRIEYRVGLNVGDIIVDDKGIYGDGVNIAAGLETLAEPGGICASHVVRDQVWNKLELLFEDMGEQQVKGITRPVSTHRILLGAKAAASSRPAAVFAASAWLQPQRPSIAVLPFANRSGDPEQEYFSEAITEDIITNLSRNRAFFVISRRTSFMYRGPALDVSRAARELGVRYLLAGSTRRAANRVCVTAQLIEAETGHRLWAQRYDRVLTEGFAAQDEISQGISCAIVSPILSAEIGQAQRQDGSHMSTSAASGTAVAES